jgi:hypothetical protein
MRRILLIISMVSAVFVGANAQPGNVRLGIKLGPTIDWASSGSTSATNDGIRLGGNLGLVCDYYLTNNVAVSSGVDFNFLRLKYTFVDHRRAEDFLEESNISVSRRLKAANIEIPLKFKVRMDVLDLFKAYAEAGAGLSLNCKDYGKDSYKFYWASYEGQSYVDCTNQYRPLQLSMIFGLGAEYEINRNLSIFAQLTFDHAFSNAFVNVLEKQTGSILRNNYIGIEFGVMH